MIEAHKTDGLAPPSDKTDGLPTLAGRPHSQAAHTRALMKEVAFADTDTFSSDALSFFFFSFSLLFYFFGRIYKRM